MSLSNLLNQAKPQLEARLKEQASAPCVLFFSLTDGFVRARVVRSAGESFQQAWEAGMADCHREAQQHKLDVRWLKIDRVLKTQATTWAELSARLAVTKRNYFRLGVSLDAELNHAFLEHELNANAMLYLGANKVEAGLNKNNFTVYATRKFGRDIELDFSPDAPVYLFTHEGLFLAEDETLSALPGADEAQWLPSAGQTHVRWRNQTALNAGRRQIKALNQEQVYALIDSSADFLARQVKESGQFIYGHFPCFGREIDTYNSLRHASTVYSMLEAWELTQNDELLAAIRQALNYLTSTLIRRYPQEDGSVLAYNVDINDEIKLGANAVSLLGLVKYDELTGDTQYRQLMEALALGMARMQDPETGCFVHVLHAKDLALKERFRIVYYDGEAAFGLMRLYGLTSDPRWLAMVERAFEHFIRVEHWKHHDHWLSYCVNELTLYKPEEKYFRFGVQNIADYLDFILKRETTFPTLLELSMAFAAMLGRIEHQHPEMRHVLQGLDIEKFHTALQHRAHYLLNGFFWPELAMYYAKPATIVGSFFIRHHSFRVRIDDVEHYLSGYVAYWKWLGREPVQSVKQARISFSPASGDAVSFPGVSPVFAANWDAVSLAQATQGIWKQAPGPNWKATGVCIFPPAFQAGNVVIVRVQDLTQDFGMPLPRLPALPFYPQAVVVEEAGVEAVREIYKGPVLAVANAVESLLGLGRYSRQNFTGTVVGVTGSAGKTTTCAMLSQMLQAWGQVGSTRHSANTSRGIAWNLASIPRNSRFWVMEMAIAIAGMQRSSSMTQPNVALITNIGPAHLQYHHSTENIARLKSMMFSGMQVGDYAVINADTLHADALMQAAEEYGLKRVTYGEQAASDICLAHYDDRLGVATITVAGQSFRLSGFSYHMACNALACLAVAWVLKLDLAHALRQLEMFEPLEGRGARFSIMEGERRLCMIDESYNANPLSMAAALKSFQWASNPGAGILLLGDMLELDSESETLHRELLPLIVDAQPRKVWLVGEHMKALVALLEQQNISVSWAEIPSVAWEEIRQGAQHNEIVMLKGSNSTGLHALVQKIKARYA